MRIHRLGRFIMVIHSVHYYAYATFILNTDSSPYTKLYIGYRLFGWMDES